MIIFYLMIQLQFLSLNQDNFSVSSYVKLINKDTLLSQDENVKFVDQYDEGLSHMIIAGSDIMLCPSFNDPLLQLPVSVS